MLFRLLSILGLFIVGLGASLMLISDVFIQIFALWIAALFILKSSFHFQPHPLKVLMLAIITVTTIHLAKHAIAITSDQPTLERFIVDWGTPKKCAGEEDLVPATTGCDIWSDPEKIVDQRVERALEETKKSVRQMEDFLHVDWPDRRERSKDSEAAAKIV
jgi:hypothetical protein